ncbi:MAG: phosphomannose isomerase type II C-terminal cupin domain [Cyanobacteria bacterium]|nr:phosphomannose isomerase type II C-terminal cupin domain [Cyanobacteriota bacterium]
MAKPKPAPEPPPAPLLSGQTAERPWGSVTVLEEGKGYRINRIVVAPGRTMSQQMHYHRSEHWIVVAGTARVTCNDTSQIVIPNQSTYVPACTPHRLENPGVIPLVMIEVQNGEFLGDEDIIRFDDPSATRP